MFMPQREFNFDKEKQFSEWYHTILYAADLVDIRYNVQGFVVHKPWGIQVIRQLYRLFEAELEADGHLPVLFPSVIPEENLEKETAHLEGFTPNVFWITKAGNETFKRPLALRPTSETAFYQMYSLWIQSRSDLPTKLYQSCSVYRFEHETIPFLRGREFLWIETHDAFATRAEAEAQVQKDIEISRRVLTQQLGVPVTVFQRPAWDKFPGADHTYAYDVLMPDGKVNQAGATHLLGQNFSKPFDIAFKDETGKDQYVHQTCFGPGIWRMIAALVSVHGDNKGLIFPLAVAPIQVIIIPILKDDEDTARVLPYCRELLGQLNAAGFRAAIDETKKTPGYKFNYWEMKGVPLRLEIGPREVESGKLTLVRRDSKEKFAAERSDIVNALFLAGETLLQSLSDKAASDLQTRLYTATSREEIKRVLESGGGFVRVPLCTVDSAGTACGQEIQQYTGGGKVRGVKAFANEKPREGATCIVCGRVAEAVVYVAKQY